MQSKNKLDEILGLKKTTAQRIFYAYIDNPLLSDILISFSGISLYCCLEYIFGCLFFAKIESIQDILNELISTSLSSGGFILAALAIIASIQIGVPDKDPNNAKTGKEFLFNSSGYKNIIKIYSLSCFLFVFLFLLFSCARFVSESINFKILTNIILGGVIMMSSSFIRCILILWKIIRIK